MNDVENIITIALAMKTCQEDTPEALVAKYYELLPEVQKSISEHERLSHTTQVLDRRKLPF